MGATGPASTPGSQHPWDPYGGCILVTVGQGHLKALYKCEASTLQFYSGYFKMILTSPGFTGQVRLPGESPQIFSMAYQYLLNRNLFPTPAQAIPLSFDKLVDFYAFGVRRNAPILQNAGVDLFVDKVKIEKCLPDRWSIEYLWEATSPGSALRKLLVEMVREMWVPDGHKHRVWNELVGGQSEDPEKLIWMIEELCKSGKHEIRVSAKMQRRVQGCEWHVHEKGEYCEGSEEARLWPGGPIGQVERYVRVSEKERSPDVVMGGAGVGGSFCSM